MKRLICAVLTVLMLITPGCAKKPNRYQAEFLSLFDTVTTIVGYSESKEEFTSIVHGAKEKLAECHRLFDIYNDYEGINNVKTINDNAGIAPVKVDEMLISMLLFAKEQYHASDGKINIAMGSVLRIWHDYRERGISNPQNAQLPSMELLQEASGYTDIDELIIDREASTVFLTDPRMSLDVGAVAKGYAVEQTALYLEGQGVSSFLISVGGNIRAIDGKPGGKSGNKMEPWSIGIKDPQKKDGNLEMCNVLIDGYSVVSSGSYERYYTVDGVRYHHIIDPNTLMPAVHFANVTIICRDSGSADALSTAVFNMPLEMGKNFVQGNDEVEALWVLHDGEIIYSQGFRDFLKADCKT